MKNKLKLAYCLALFLCISTQIANAQYPAYHNDHDCKNLTGSTTGICGLLNKVRKNGSPATRTTEPETIMAVHRGLWGGDVPENSKASFNAAINFGYKLIEADIMPAGITNYINENIPSTFGVPSSLVCFHDFKLKRMTTSSDNSYVFQKTEDQLKNITLKKPRDTVGSNQKICTLKELVQIAFNNNRIACLDIKNLENNGTTELTQWTSTTNKLISLKHNIRWAINNIPEEQLKNVAIKTYESYTTIYNQVASGQSANFIRKFNKVLWIPMIAKNDKFETNGQIDVSKVDGWLTTWGGVKERVLYFEVNIFSDNHITKKYLEPLFLDNGSWNGDTVCLAINYQYGRRVGIFSEEPVGSKGTVNRWGKWSYKDPKADRRGDLYWILNDIPEMRKGVITTDRPDHWQNYLNDVDNVN